VRPLRIIIKEIKPKSARSPATIEVGCDFSSSANEVWKTGKTTPCFGLADSIYVEPWWASRTNSLAECHLFL